jgi:signal transduction histidine kinase
LSKLEKDEISILPKIEERINHLDGFIRDILSHSRNLNSAVIIEKLNLTKIINDCFDELEYLPNSSKVSKRITVSGKDFYSDYIRVTEICRNLVSNAIKYQDVQKPSNYVHVDCRITPKSLKIIFEDNGIGIEEAYISEIFNMFYRATEVSEGSGIGLYIVKQAADKLEGSVTVNSILHQGTKFVITLPNLISKKQE